VTDPSEASREPYRPDLRDAIADLERLRGLLQRFSRGESDVGQVRAALENYWRAHKAELGDAARAVAEQVRQTLLQALYRWREQLQQQPPRDTDR
jgi:hypothetical protein